MNCPFCNKEMKAGSVMTNREKLAWSPKGAKKSLAQHFTNLAVHKNSLEFGKWEFWHGAKTSAAYCPNCKKIIIDMQK